MKRLSLGILVLLSFLVSSVYAEEIKIVFTGQSFAALYTCSCPKGPEGGVARRAATIKRLREIAKNVLLLEAGSSFASGPQDQYTQDAQTDSVRTDVYLKAIGMMHYDALLVDSQSMVLGVDFFKAHNKLPFVSSNTQGLGVSSVIKNFGAIKVGVIGLTDALIVSRGIKDWQAPAEGLSSEIAALKGKGVSVIVLLSSLLSQEDEELLKNNKGIDVVINSGTNLGSVVLKELDGVTYLATWWQGQKIGVLTLNVEDGKIVDRKLENIPLGRNVPDDNDVASLLPKCFQTLDCAGVPGLVSKCENGGTPEARCTYTTMPRINLTIIQPRACRTCRVDEVTNDLKKIWGDLKISTLFDDDPKAQVFIKDLKIAMLPAYIFEKEIEKTELFPTFKNLLDKSDNYYMLKPRSVGVSYFMKRKKIAKRLDVFYDYTYPPLGAFFELLKAFQQKHKDIDIRLNFLATEDKEGTLLTLGPASQEEEFKRISCVADLYPGAVFDYAICRAGQKDASWWDECALANKIDPGKVKKCALSIAGRVALKKHIQLTEEMEVATGPTFLIDNVEVFSIVSVPSLEELEAIVLGEKNNKK